MPARTNDQTIMKVILSYLFVLQLALQTLAFDYVIIGGGTAYVKPFYFNVRNW